MVVEQPGGPTKKAGTRKGKEPLTGWRKWGTYALVAVLVWHAAAMLFACLIGGDTVEFGDRTGTAPASVAAKAKWGLGAGTTQSVVLEYPTTVSKEPVLRLVGSYRDKSTLKWLNVELQFGSRLTPLRLPYDRVDWQTTKPGQNPTATFVFDEESIDVLLEGQGYSYWRFMTFRGAASYNPVPWDFFYDYGVDRRTFFEEHVSSLTVTIPNEPEWQVMREIVG